MTSSFNFTTSVGQILATTNTTQVFSILIDATAFLPECTIPCFQSSVPDIALDHPEAFFLHICANGESVAPVIGSCINKACPAADLDSIAQVINIQPLACLQLQTLAESAASDNWTVSNAAIDISFAKSIKDLTYVLNNAQAQLPACATKCMESSVPTGIYGNPPLNATYFEYACKNVNTIVPKIEDCITTGCNATVLDTVAGVLNLQPLGCAQLENLSVRAATTTA
ncbi:hypothetical protein HDU99_005360 [Rhizoclosmatium hyalinum]|nr:hypothetical protein HDU99_005360 [Rhizoclosmatium hyalinum]